MYAPHKWKVHNYRKIDYYHIVVIAQSKYHTHTHTQHIMKNAYNNMLYYLKQNMTLVNT